MTGPDLPNADLPNAYLPNAYLQGNFAPVLEEVTVADLDVTGTLPDSLDGRYLRNGPNPSGNPDPATYHWFTGEGMVHGIRIRGGRAEWYRNRWVHSEEFPPNTNVIGLGGRTLAIVEAGAKPVELSDELETIGAFDFDGTLPNGFTAHPKRDPDSGQLHAANYFWARPGVIQYVVIGPDGRVDHIEDVAVPGNPMVHDISITESHVVLYDQCVTFDLDSAMAGVTLPYRWNPDYGCRLGVMAKDRTGRRAPQWFEVEPCYVFHPLNAYEINGGRTVVLDVIRHERVFDRNPLAPDESVPSLWRWTLDLDSGSVIETRLDDTPCEFPRVDERVIGRPYTYGLSVSLNPGPDGGPISFDGARIICRNMGTGSVVTHDPGKRTGVGEAVFIPSDPQAQGLDGYVMFLAYDMDLDRSELRVLAAQDLAGDPIARVHLPVRVPFGFHGNWVPS